MSAQPARTIPAEDHAAPPRPRSNLLKRIARFVATWRSLPPYELVSYPLMFAAVPMLAVGAQRYDASLVRILLFTVISQYSGFFAALIWNDITDADIDAVVHPDRPIPAGRITKVRFFGIAVLFAISTIGFAWMISPWALAVTLSVAAYVGLHDLALKRYVPIPAYSEIATPMQWTAVGIFGFVAVWSRLPHGGDWTIALPVLGPLSASPGDWGRMVLLAAFIYFTDACHDLPEGIVDADGDRAAGVRTYTTSFGERRAAVIALVWFLLSGVLGVALFAVTSLSYLFLCGFLVLLVYSGVDFVRLARTSDVRSMTELARALGRKGFNHFLFVFDLMFVDLLVQVIARHLRTR